MKKCFIFAHHDKNNEVQSYILDELNLLKELGDVLFISDCEYISNIDKLMGLKYIQISRHGLYDAYSYYSGFKYLKDSGQLDSYDSVTFVNSSISFPTCDKQVFITQLNDMDNMPEKVYGMCKSAYLLQSYWITFKKEVYSFVDTFWSNYTHAYTNYVMEWWNKNLLTDPDLIRCKNSIEKRKKEVGEELTAKWMYTVIHFEQGFSKYLYHNHFNLIACDYGCWPKSRFITKASR